ncbi:hypothetical protein SEA_NANOSMITE_127 [Mycobacterium phage Nanosmite]|nr:hypothetical protein SEA_NANOSMITE_127 [Mycobacterium phage Nanosmite]
MGTRYGVRYPSGTVHECPFGESQAHMIAMLAAQPRNLGVFVPVVVWDELRQEWV